MEQTDVLGETLRIVEEWLGQKPEFGPIRVELTVAEADGWGFPDLLRSALPEVEVREGEVEGAPRGGLASAVAFALAVLRIVDADPVEAAKAVAGKG